MERQLIFTSSNVLIGLLNKTMCVLGFFFLDKEKKNQCTETQKHCMFSVGCVKLFWDI